MIETRPHKAPIEVKGVENPIFALKYKIVIIIEKPVFLKSNLKINLI